MYIFKKETLENLGFSKTRKQMAEIIGVSESYFSKILNIYIQRLHLMKALTL